MYIEIKKNVSEKMFSVISVIIQSCGIEGKTVTEFRKDAEPDFVKRTDKEYDSRREKSA